MIYCKNTHLWSNFPIIKHHCFHTVLPLTECKTKILNAISYITVLQIIDLSDIEKTVQNKTSESRGAALQIIIWLTKALVMRGHQRSQTMILFVSTSTIDTKHFFTWGKSQATFIKPSFVLMQKSLKIKSVMIENFKRCYWLLYHSSQDIW